jgi:drug/metabolite transporter (DMT)-like permease
MDFRAMQLGLGLEMKSGFGIFAVAVMAFALMCPSAEAGPIKRRKEDPRLTASGFVVGAGMTAAFFALRDWSWKEPRNAKVSGGAATVITTVGCMALSPIVGTVVVQRELTLREAYVMTADCIVPFVGGWLMSKAFDDHPEWEGKRPGRR